MGLIGGLRTYLWFAGSPVLTAQLWSKLTALGHWASRQALVVPCVVHLLQTNDNRAMLKVNYKIKQCQATKMHGPYVRTFGYMACLDLLVCSSTEPCRITSVAGSQVCLSMNIVTISRTLRDSPTTQRSWNIYLILNKFIILNESISLNLQNMLAFSCMITLGHGQKVEIWTKQGNQKDYMNNDTWNSGTLLLELLQMVMW